jgi:hypothetical protein
MVVTGGGLRHRLRGTGWSCSRAEPAADDPSNVLIMHGFGTTADAEKFLAGTELRDAMQQAGVQGQPRVEIYQDA